MQFDLRRKSDKKYVGFAWVAPIVFVNFVCLFIFLND